MRPFSHTRIPAVFTGARRPADRPGLVRLLGAFLLGAALLVPTAVAQQDGERDRDWPDRDRQVDDWPDRDRQDRDRQDRDRQDRDRQDRDRQDRDRQDRDRPDGNWPDRNWPNRNRQDRDEGAELRVLPGPRPPVGDRIVLGVYASPAEVGYRVDGVQRGTPAARVGLEPGDVIVAVDGYQVGRVGREFYPLGRELQRRGGHDLEVVLLVQDVRSRRLLGLDVDFRWRGPFSPMLRDREWAGERPGRAATGAPAEEGVGEAEVEGERRGELQ